MASEDKKLKEEYRVVITGIYLKNGDFARGRSVITGEQLIDLEKALELGYVKLESEAKKEDKELEKVADEPELTPAQKAAKTRADKAEAAEKEKQELEEAHASYLDKFFSDAPKGATLDQIKEALATEKPIETK